jgi:hypothetical protein
MPDEHLIGLADGEPRWLPNVQLFFQVAVEEGQLHIHVVYALSHMHSHHQDCAHRLHPRHRGEDFLKIHPLTLHIALGNELDLVLDDAPALILLCIKHPLEADRVMTSHLLFS